MVGLQFGEHQLPDGSGAGGKSHGTRSRLVLPCTTWLQRTKCCTVAVTHYIMASHGNYESPFKCHHTEPTHTSTAFPHTDIQGGSCA
jgi:hypothetical protein